MIVSMGLVAPAFCAGVKTRTMRIWNPKTVEMARRHYETSKPLDVWSSSPRVKGGEWIGKAELKEPPFHDVLAGYAPSLGHCAKSLSKLYIDEGFEFMDSQFILLKYLAKMTEQDKELYTVLRFKPIPILGMDDKYCKTQVIADYRLKLLKWMKAKVA